MRISHKTNQGIPIILIQGEIEQHTLPMIHYYVDPLFEEVKKDSEAPGIIFDMSEVKFIDSVGIGFLCGRHITLKRLQKKLILCDINEYIWEILKELSLHDAFYIHTDEETTVEKLKESKKRHGFLSKSLLKALSPKSH